MADASITARIGGDASGLVAALEQGKQAAGKFATDFGNVMAKKLSFKDIFRGVFQGIGIASVPAIVDKIVAPFKEAAEAAQKIEISTGRAADAVERMIKLRQTEAQQLVTAEKTIERITKLIETKKNEAPSKSYLGGLIGRGSAVDVMFGFSRREDAARREEIQDLSTKLQEKSAETQPLSDKVATDKAMVERWAQTLKEGKIIKEAITAEDLKQLDIVQEVTKTEREANEERIKQLTAEKNLQASIAGIRGGNQFNNATDAALAEVARRNRAEANKYGSGAYGYGMGQDLERARLDAEAMNAEKELKFRTKLRGDISLKGVEAARRGFQGDPLKFDEIINRLVTDKQTGNEVLREQTDLLEKINNRLAGGIPTMQVAVIAGGS